MAETADWRAKDFGGLILEADEHDLQPGASPEQVNCTSDEIGSLRSRPGIAILSFEDD